MSELMKCILELTNMGLKISFRENIKQNSWLITISSPKDPGFALNYWMEIEDVDTVGDEELVSVIKRMVDKFKESHPDIFYASECDSF